MRVAYVGRVKVGQEKVHARMVVLPLHVSKVITGAYYYVFSPYGRLSLSCAQVVQGSYLRVFPVGALMENLSRAPKQRGRGSRFITANGT